jgi:hypothetical protein
MTVISREIVDRSVGRRGRVVLVPGVQISTRHDRVFGPVVSHYYSQSISLKILSSAAESIDLSVASVHSICFAVQPVFECVNVTRSPCMTGSVCGIPSNSVTERSRPLFCVKREVIQRLPAVRVADDHCLFDHAAGDVLQLGQIVIKRRIKVREISIVEISAGGNKPVR